MDEENGRRRNRPSIPPGPSACFWDFHADRLRIHDADPGNRSAMRGFLYAVAWFPDDALGSPDVLLWFPDAPLEFPNALLRFPNAPLGFPNIPLGFPDAPLGFPGALLGAAYRA